jgi:hypothetical protein
VPEPPQIAWQPLTFGGVAAFARAKLGRLLLVQGIFALMTAAVVVWFLANDWFPIIHQAIRQLPAEGQIRSGTLERHGDSPVRLAENHFLAIAIDLPHQGQARSPAQVQAEFGGRNVRFFSLFGYMELQYPKHDVIAFNRTELDPWWGAWAPAILAIVALAVIGGSLTVWAGLAAIYLLPVWLIGFFRDRDLKPGSSWRLAGAALLPGALLMDAAILFYGLGVLDPVQLTAAGLVHLVVGWVYLVGGVWKAPKHVEAMSAATNPFAPAAKP